MSKEATVGSPVEPIAEPTSPRAQDVSDAWIASEHGRPLFAFAHQDDEIVVAGLVARVLGAGGRGTFLWWTNGDGLAPGAGADPAEYGRLRIDEATESVHRLGGHQAAKIDLECSEIENYRRFVAVAAGGPGAKNALDYFRAEAERVEQAVREADPDRVFILAWQGGQPEHDLTHVMVTRAVRRLRQETGRPIPIIGAPAYEYTILCPMRFKPWYRGDRRAIRLDGEEMARKLGVLEAYGSQAELFRQFTWVVRGLGVISSLWLRPFGARAYLSREVFGVVDPDLDLLASTHRFEALNYMGDHFEGEAIRFDTMIRPITEAILS